MLAGDAPDLSPLRRRLGWLALAAMLGAIVVELAVYASSWRPEGYLVWTRAPLGAVKAGASAVTVSALIAALVLPITGSHWPGLLAGRRAQAAGWCGLALFGVLIAVHELTFKLFPGAEVSTWSNDTELRANAVYQLMVFVFALPLLFGSRRGDARALPEED